MPGVFASGRRVTGGGAFMKALFRAAGMNKPKGGRKKPKGGRKPRPGAERLVRRAPGRNRPINSRGLTSVLG